MPSKRKLWLILIGLGLAGLLIAAYQGWQYASRAETRLYALDAETGRVQWSTSLGTHNWVSQPVVSDGRVFVDTIPEKSHARALAAFDAATGRPVWTYTPDPTQPVRQIPSPSAAPLANAGVVIDDLSEETFGLFEAATGALRQSFTPASLPAHCQPAALAANRLAVLVRQDDYTHLSLQVFDLQTSALLWQTAIEADIYTDQQPLVIGAGRVFVNNRHQVDAFDLESGQLQFSLAVTPHQLQRGDTQIYVTDYRQLSAFETATGALRWTFSPPPDPPTDFSHLLDGLQADGQTVYISNLNRESRQAWLFALDAADGRERWRQLLADYSSGLLDPSTAFFTLQPAVAAQTVFVINDLQDAPALTALAAADGKELWRFPLYTWTGRSPATDGTRVFLVDRAPRWRNWLSTLNLASS